MATVSRMRTNPASLLVQVTHAERDVLDRRRHVVVRATSFHQSIRRRLTSPKTLLFAGGLGNFAERLTRRQIAERRGGLQGCAALNELGPSHVCTR